MIKTILSWLLLILGVLGIAVCIVVMIETWMLYGRVHTATGDVFEQVDVIISQVQDRLEQSKAKTEQLKLRTDGIKQSLENWTKEEVRERVTSKLPLEDRSAQLAAGLRQADGWLELAQSSVRVASQGLNLVHASQTKTRFLQLPQLQSQITKLREELSKAIQSVENIQDWAAGAEMGEHDSRWEQILTLSVRVLATLGTIDTGLERLTEQLSELQNEVRQVKTSALWWLRMMAIAITLLAFWMLAVQLALRSVAWKRLRGNGASPVS